MPPEQPSQPHVPQALRRAYDLMRRQQGHQQWWPARTPIEVCLGAILTQNTQWSNVETALAQLEDSGPLDPHHLHSLTHEQLARLIRPAGCPRVKARRLKAFLHALVEEHQGNLDHLLAGPATVARERLLAIHGVGPETADCILLYAGGLPSFVIDAYTRRIFARHAWCRANASYSEVQQLCEGSLGRLRGGRLLDYWQDYHAQLVRVGKLHCRPREPRCSGCPLEPLLAQA